MKRFVYYLILFIAPTTWALSVHAQENKITWDAFLYTSTWGYLYADASEKAKPMGLFSTHAPVLVLDSTTSYYRVMVSNGDVGFIKQQPFLRRLFASDDHIDEPSEFFYRGREGAQSPHQYVQVAELRVRSEPSIESNIQGKLAINEIAFFDYWPLYEDGWVYIGDPQHRRPKYIQAKYLGKELMYDDVWLAYQAVAGNNIQQELIYVGRLREIAWKNNHKDLSKTLRLYEEVYKRAGQTNLRIDIAQEQLLAEKMAGRPDYNAYHTEWNKLNAHYRIHGSIMYDAKISKKQVQQVGLKYAKNIPNAPECGWEPLHFYLDSEVVIAFEKQISGQITGSVYSMTFTLDNAWVIGEEIIDKSYTENDFIQKYGHFIDVDILLEPHVYRIMLGDAGFYQITFKNNRPILFQCFYYC